MSGTITPIGVGTAAAHAKQASAGEPLDPFADPGDTNAPILFEPPPGLTGGVNEVWVLATGGADWGGCQVWISSDGNTYAFAGTIYQGGRQGVLTAPLPEHADPDTVNTLAVDLSESRGQMISGTTADADSFVTLCYCDGELVSFETATLTASYRYSLTYLRRGLYGTAIGAHGSGSQFGRLGPSDPAVFRYAYPASFIGHTVYLKLPGFNIFGQELQSLAAVTPYSLVLVGAGTNPLSNPVIAGLAAGTGSDWGIVDGSLIAAADFGAVSVAVGASVNLGMIP
jgi:hypothetical protein